MVVYSRQRRKIIDEIAGTADFDRKISLATEQIQSVEDRVANTNILMGEIDNRIEQLKQEREVALKYKKFKDEKTELETKIQSAKYFDTQRALELVHQNILLATKTKKELTQKLKEAESKITDNAILEKVAQKIEDLSVEYMDILIRGEECPDNDFDSQDVLEEETASRAKGDGGRAFAAHRVHYGRQRKMGKETRYAA